MDDMAGVFPTQGPGHRVSKVYICQHDEFVPFIQPIPIHGKAYEMPMEGLRETGTDQFRGSLYLAGLVSRLQHEPMAHRLCWQVCNYKPADIPWHMQHPIQVTYLLDRKSVHFLARRHPSTNVWL
jgi:hypothetical protein